MSRKPKDDAEKKKEVLHFRTTEAIVKKIIQEIGERTIKNGKTYTISEILEKIIIEYFETKEGKKEVK